MPRDPFDYIIIGGGSAGCLLANRLSQDSSKQVLLVEAGQNDRYHWIHIPVGYLYCIGNPRTDWLYHTEPDIGLNGRSLRYPRGKSLGGCSSINGMIYMRGQARDYDHWAALTQDESWSWNQCLPDFKAHEDHYRLDTQNNLKPSKRAEFDKFHGHGGEWRIEKQRLRWDILDHFADAAIQAGVPWCDDFNTGDNFGVGYFEVNQRQGWRWNTAKAFLRPAKDRHNLTVWTQAHVDRLVFESEPNKPPRCVGVLIRRAGDWVTVRAHREVILCAGAIGSPQLLQVSGIGPEAVLRDHNIQPIAVLPGVGENLQDHLQIRAVYKVKGVKTLNTMANSWFGKAAIGLEYMLRRTGPMSMAPSQLGAFTRSDPEQPYANLEYHIQPLSLDAFGEKLHPFDAFTASVCNLNPTSRGRVSIQSTDTQQPPLIQPNYLSTDVDQQNAIQSLRQIRHIVQQPALKPFEPEEWRPGANYTSDEQLLRLAGDIATTIFHPVGTAKMSHPEDPMGVVDARLRVRGVVSLRVVDASVMPTITSGNTNSPTLMIAEKAARWIQEDSI
jgi:choline dehydrogenase